MWGYPTYPNLLLEETYSLSTRSMPVVDASCTIENPLQASAETLTLVHGEYAWRTPGLDGCEALLLLRASRQPLGLIKPFLYSHDPLNKAQPGM